MLDLSEIMDDMCELIYIADTSTYELRFINSQGKKLFQLDENYIGQKCYRVLQGRDEPCPFCTNDLLVNNEVYSWEVYNPLLKRHYALKDKRIVWKGKPARIEIAIDTTESEEEKQRLQHTVESERIIMDCIRILYQSSALEKTLPEILQKVCHFLKAKRTYYIKVADYQILNVYEWSTENGMAQPIYLKNIDRSLAEKWFSYINKHECCVIHNLKSIQETHKEIYALLHLQGIHSLVITPLEQDGEAVAYLGVDNPPKEMTDSSSMLFYTLRYFLMAAIRREANEKQLTQLSYHDSLTGAYNRNRYTKELQELHKSNIPVGIVYLDINGLKTINDQQGHAAGDEVVKLLAQTVADVFGLPQLYRIGGDEFVVLCKNTSKDQFFSLLRKLETKFDALNGYSAAVGHQWADSSHDLAHDISAADAMMYDNKRKYYRGKYINSRYRSMNDEALMDDPDDCVLR